MPHPHTASAEQEATPHTTTAVIDDPTTTTLPC
jgi:hypothetical protein